MKITSLVQTSALPVYQYCIHHDTTAGVLQLQPQTTPCLSTESVVSFVILPAPLHYLHTKIPLNKRRDADNSPKWTHTPAKLRLITQISRTDARDDPVLSYRLGSLGTKLSQEREHDINLISSTLTSPITLCLGSEAEWVILTTLRPMPRAPRVPTLMPMLYACRTRMSCGWRRWVCSVLFCVSGCFSRWTRPQARVEEAFFGMEFDRVGGELYHFLDGYV